MKPERNDSRHWLRILVNDHPLMLNRRIAEALGRRTPFDIDWRSPLAAEDFAEYRDQKALERLGCVTPKEAWGDCWPARGPAWDALGRCDETGELFFVDGKARIDELRAGPASARGEARERIAPSLARARKALGSPRRGLDWDGPLLGLATRLTQLHFLRELNGQDAYLVNIYFVNDPSMNSPRNEAQWRGAIELAEALLGLKAKHKLRGHIAEVFYDVGNLDSGPA